MCYRVPLEFDETISFLSMDTIINQEENVCCRPTAPCQINGRISGQGGECPVDCRYSLPTPVSLTVSIWIFAVISVYVALFLVPMPALYVQNHSSPELAEYLGNAGGVIARARTYSLPKSIQLANTFSTIAMVTCFLTGYIVWILVGVFFVVPTTTSKHHSYSRTCRPGAFPWVVLATVLFIMSIGMLAFCVDRINCNVCKAGTCKNKSKKDGYTYQSPVYLCYEFQGCAVLAWFLFGLVPLTFLVEWVKRIKEKIKHPAALVIILYIITFPIHLAKILLFSFGWIPAVRFYLRGWRPLLAMILPDKDKEEEDEDNEAEDEDNEEEDEDNEEEDKDTVEEGKDKVDLKDVYQFLRSLLDGLSAWGAICLIWLTLIATFDTMSFIFFTFIAYIVVETAATLYVTGAIVGVLFEISRRFISVDEDLLSIHGAAMTQTNELHIDMDLKQAETDLIEQVNGLDNMAGHGQEYVNYVKLIAIYRQYLYTAPRLYELPAQAVVRITRQIDSLRVLKKDLEK